MLRFTIFGIPVTVQPFFWITLAIIGALSNGGGTSAMALYGIALFVLAGFISILIHELGHAMAARRFGARCHIVLQAFGGYAAYTGVPMNRRQSFMITAAGPLLQVIFGLLIAWISSRMPTLQPPAQYFISTLVLISLFWAIFNLLPILPLDGGRLMEAVLGPQRIKTTLWITILTASAIGLLALFFTGSIFAPLFMGMFAWQAWKALQQIHSR